MSGDQLLIGRAGLKPLRYYGLVTSKSGTPNRNRPVHSWLGSSLIFTLILILMFGGNSARAQVAAPTPRPVTDDEVNRISRALYCPVCQNITLEVCPTEACARWREQVRDLLTEGKTEPEIRQYFIDRFGMRTVGLPTDPTGQLLSVGIPLVLVLVVGGLLAFNILSRRRRGTASAVDDGEPIGYGDEVVVPDDYAARLEAQLKELR